jgi:hypothetical protein
VIAVFRVSALAGIHLREIVEDALCDPRRRSWWIPSCADERVDEPSEDDVVLRRLLHTTNPLSGFVS